MAMEAKADFMRNVEKGLEELVSVANMAKIMQVVASVLDGYEMRGIERWDEQDDYLKCFVSALNVQCRSEKTIARYVYEIKRLMAFVGVPTRRVTVYHLRNYLSQEKARGIADSTLESMRQIFSSYFNWLQRESLIDKNPVANLGAIKCAKKQKQTITEIDMERLNAACTNPRDRAIIHFLSSTGCRVSEMTGLNRSEVNFDRLECVVHGKGNKERTVYLSPVAGMLLQRYLKSRTDDDEALFIGKRHERLNPSGVRYMLNQVAEKAGVDHIHPHKFRRTLATELARHGMPIQEVSAYLGHEKIDTTMGYVILDKDSIKSDYRKFA